MSKAAKKNVKTWLKGLAAALLGGAVSMILDPHALVENPKSAGRVALGGAAIAVIGYLKTSPLSDCLASDDDEPTNRA